MKADLFYASPAGRALFRAIQSVGGFRLAARFLRTGLSRGMISPFLRKNKVDMTEFAGQTYGSFADFFARRRTSPPPDAPPGTLLSPCDGLVSACPIEETTEMLLKGVVYRVEDLLCDRETAERFAGGLALIFRLEAADYHYFCSFDDCVLKETRFLPGQLHSVQPIACRSVPVYRRNRRWWSVLETGSFGTAVQIEIGAMMVGGVRFLKESGAFSRGEEMGNFELAGSTIVLLLSPEVRRRLELFPPYQSILSEETEVRVRMGERLGRLL